MHHPADRLSSGLDRAEFPDQTNIPFTQYRSTRLLSVLEALVPEGDPRQKDFEKSDNYTSVYSLAPLSAKSISPVPRKDISKKEAVEEYQKLFDGFIAELEELPHGNTPKMWGQHSTVCLPVFHPIFLLQESGELSRMYLCTIIAEQRQLRRYRCIYITGKQTRCTERLYRIKLRINFFWYQEISMVLRILFFPPEGNSSVCVPSCSGEVLLRFHCTVNWQRMPFRDREGSLMTPDHIRNTIWTPPLKKAELEYRPPKQTRHTFATIAIDSGESLGWVQYMLGHTSLQMIFQTYHSWIKRATQNNGSAMMKSWDVSSEQIADAA